MVLIPEVVRNCADPPATVQAGLHRLLHRLLRVGQIDHCQRADGQADGNGWPSGDAA